MYSATEERMRATIEKLATVLTGTGVEIVPGDDWMAMPHADPPKLVYRLADVGAFSDRMLGVTAHEIAELLYTGDWTIPWDDSKKPRAAQLLFNVVNDARIERVFAGQFGGASSLFAEIHGPAPGGPWDTKTVRNFDKLPIKWRFLFNVDRHLHGLSLLGDARDKSAIAEVQLSLDGAAQMFPEGDSRTDIDRATQHCVGRLEPAYLKLLDLMRQERNEKEAERRRLQKVAEDAVKRVKEREAAKLAEQMRPPDYVKRPPMEDPEDAAERTGNESDFEHEKAEKDDHMVGGIDGSPGAREKADGPEGPAGAGEGSRGEGEGDSGEGVDPDAPGDGRGQDGEADVPAGGAASGAGPGDDGDGEAELAPEDRLKPTNIVEQMLDEEKGTTNTLIRLLRSRHNARAKEAKALREKIEAEKELSWGQLGEQLGMAGGVRRGTTDEMKRALARNLDDYFADRAELMPIIASLRHHADSVIRDNATERFGGSYTRGRRLKRSRLHRVAMGDGRVFERREEIGGKSYAGVLVCDQSTSMDLPLGKIDALTSSFRFADHDEERVREYNRLTKQFLVYQCALVFLEAYDGVIDTGLVGFTTFGKAIGRPNTRYDPFNRTGKIRVWSRKRRRYVYVAPKQPKDRQKTPDRETILPGVMARSYKSTAQDLRHHRLLVPELRWSHGGTPMDYGIRLGTEQLRGNPAQVRFLLMITDGRPTPDSSRAEKAFHEAKKMGIEAYSMFIAESDNEDKLKPADREAWNFLVRNSDRAALVHSREQIQVGVYRLLRTIVRRRRLAA